MSSIKCQFLEIPQWELGDTGLFNIDLEIRVHRFFIPSYLNAIPSFFLLLNEEEKKRANNYLQQKDSQRFIIARALLKILASQYLNLSTAELTIQIGVNKKPFIQSVSSIPLDYNISHSGNWIIMAFGNGPIGIDAEQIQTSFGFESLLPACFSIEEQKYIQSQSNSRELFYRLWTRKESFVKATSRGLDETLPHLICLDGERELSKHFSIGLSWRILSFTLDHEHVASLSVEDDKKNILFMEQDIVI